MKVKEIGQIELSKDNKAWYERKGYKLTGQTLTIAHDDETETEYVVFKGRWTRSGTIRDCGDHYKFAGYSRYYKIDKESLEITEAVED